MTSSCYLEKLKTLNVPRGDDVHNPIDRRAGAVQAELVELRETLRRKDDARLPVHQRGMKAREEIVGHGVELDVLAQRREHGRIGPAALSRLLRVHHRLDERRPNLPFEDDELGGVR